ncbi:potassium channel subfamily K member 6-like isoform X1 [Babylonia areolata]|uniref:potassium channel subfamily K member 6-like isoform X1 n=1 Tax=Babylonia areolata TaxID=304850 RepID=UPI003FD5D639
MTTASVILSTASSWARSPACRLLVHVLVFVGYLCAGAALFQVLENPLEESLVLDLRAVRDQMSYVSRECISDEELEQFIEKVVKAANRGVSATRNVTMSEPNWSFGQAFFFATTVLTTIGYGRVTPLSDAGKAFCIIYAILGIPLTLVLFTALVERILIPVKAMLYLLFRKFGNQYKAFHIQLLHLMLTVLVLVSLFMLVPAAIYTVLEPSWNYLDAFYYCFISLTTIGLGDFIPGDNAEQPHRALYKVATTVYLLLGLLMMMVMLSVLYEIPELNVGFHFYLKNDNPEEERSRLRPGDPGTKYHRQPDEAESQPVRGGGGGVGGTSSDVGTYQSFQNKDIGEEEE